MTILNLRLTSEQQRLVEEHLELVAQVLNKHIRRTPGNPDMSWEELYQTGCLALCKAALYYDSSREFGPYAARAIRNALFDYCCKVANYRKPLCSLETTPELPVTHTEPMQLYNEAVKKSLKNHHQSSTRAVQKGIYSLLKKADGFTITDISKEFGVSPNLVRAWMSLASKKLRQDTKLYKLLA